MMPIVARRECVGDDFPGSRNPGKARITRPQMARPNSHGTNAKALKLNLDGASPLALTCPPFFLHRR